MNRIDQKFSDLKQKNEKALVGFLTAGDPDYSRSLEIISAMCDAGLDVLELGVPFSDPTADGPMIQRSSARSLAKGMKMAGVLRMTAELRQHTDIPIVLFSYYNPIHAFGVEAFHREALSAGADGVLVVDLPLEESAEMTSRWPDDRLRLIRLVAPTTPPSGWPGSAKRPPVFYTWFQKPVLPAVPASTGTRSAQPIRCFTVIRPCPSASALVSPRLKTWPPWPRLPKGWSSAAPLSG